MIDIVTGLIETYDTSNPYELCRCLNIKINYCDLGKNIGGFYQRIDGFEIIHISINENEQMQKYIIAHELGHAICHPELSISYFYSSFQIKNKYEIEADKFALYLLITCKDVDSLILSEMTIEQIASTLEIPIKLLNQYS